jgi:hypothetical protein
MRSLALAALLVAAASFSSANASPPPIARLDAVGPTVLVLHGDLSAARRKVAVHWAGALIRDVGVRFTATAEPKREVNVHLFEEVSEYAAFANAITSGDSPSPLGFYLPGKRVVVVNFAAGARNMSHELTHALVGDDFPSIPAWMNEGLGSLYGGAELTARGMTFKVNYRHRDVLQAIRTNTLPTLEQLAAVSDEELYGPRAMVWYGFARAVLLFLESRGELSAFYREARAGAPIAPLLRRSMDDARFRKWAVTLRAGQQILPPRR